MESLYFLIPLSIVVLALGIGIFFWAVKNGQYDDLDGEAERILFDDLDMTGLETPVIDAAKTEILKINTPPLDIEDENSHQTITAEQNA